MKKIFLFLSVSLLLNFTLKAQAPQGFNYQAVARNTTGIAITNQNIGLEISLRQGSATGIIVYTETFNTSSNNIGLINVVVGTGTVIAGTFNTINWGSGVYFIEISMDITGGTSYALMGTQQLMSVPYALFSANGTPGATGAAGTNGTNGIDGATGAIGTNGTNGLVGATGAAGTNGTNGLVGATGAAGTNGTVGATGATGLLSSGTAAGNTPYWNGSQWIINNSNIHNNGAGIGIGTTSPNASAKFEIASITQGLLPPRMTTVQRDAIASAATGLVIFNTTTNCLNFFTGSGWNETCGILNTTGAIIALNCVGATTTGTLNNGIVAIGVSTTVPYTGGNGGIYSVQAFSSTGVLGLTANISGSTLALGAGNLVYTISGTPTSSGTASFAITVCGQSCSFTVSVGAAVVYPAGTVNCAGATAVVDVINTTTGKIWMDRNLGATQEATSSTDSNAYGDLYQWGRRADGHQCRTSATTATLSSIDQPAHGNFIQAPSYPYDWRSPQNSNLWQGVNGVNNPCPSGYRIPTETELEAERLSWSVNTWMGAFASPLKLPLPGALDFSDGSIIGVGTFGFYWSTKVSAESSTYLSFGSSSTPIITITSRAYGFAVRCIKD